MGKHDSNLPLLNILRELDPIKRQIILDHLDAKSCDTVVACIAKVIQNGKKLKSNKVVKETIVKNKKDICALLSKGGNFKKRRRKLAKFGGGPLGLLLGIGLPILVDLVSQAFSSSKAPPKPELPPAQQPSSVRFHER